MVVMGAGKPAKRPVVATSSPRACTGSGYTWAKLTFSVWSLAFQPLVERPAHRIPSPEMVRNCAVRTNPFKSMRSTPKTCSGPCKLMRSRGLADRLAYLMNQRQ